MRLHVSLVSTGSRSDRISLHTFEGTQPLVNQASSTFHYKTVGLKELLLFYATDLISVKCQGVVK